MAEPRNPNSSSDKKENPRKAIREARAARLRVIDGPPTTIKVYPANETMRASLRHSTGARFREKMDQAVEWPNDGFTHRRLKEGSIRLEPGSGEAPKPDPTKNAREQAEVGKPKKEAGTKPAPAPAQARPPQPTPPAPPTQTPPQPPPAAA